MQEPFFPEVTVIVPALNAAATIACCLESLLKQNYAPERYRIVVVDNNSTDSTPAIVSRYPVQLALEKEIQSPGAARNCGIALTTTEILAFIDSDCRAQEDWLRNLVGPFRDPSVGVVGGYIDFRLSGESKSMVEEFVARARVSSGKQFPPCEPMGLPAGNVAYRRAALQRVGSFDGAMDGGEDVDLAWRVQAYGHYRGFFVPEAVVHHKSRATLSSLYHQYRRYGRDDIVLSTLYRGQAFHRRTPGHQVRKMLLELRALGTYCVSLVVRLTRFRCWRADRLYLAWPALWLVLQSAHLTGAAEGLVRTRFFRRNPVAGQPGAIDRSQWTAAGAASPGSAEAE